MPLSSLASAGGPQTKTPTLLLGFPAATLENTAGQSGWPKKLGAMWIGCDNRESSDSPEDPDSRDSRDSRDSSPASNLAACETNRA